MNKTIKLVAASLVALVCSQSSFAQGPLVTTTADARAHIFIPLTIGCTQHMEFGNIGVGSTGGDVVLNTSDARPTNTGDTYLPTTTGTVASAQFTVNGEPSAYYYLTLPTGSYTLKKLAGTATMLVDTWTSTLAGGAHTLTGGTASFAMGATLHVGGSQTPGSYSLTIYGDEFPVSVNY